MTRAATVSLILLSIAAGAADKDKPFKPGPAESYPGHQTFEGVVVAAVPYTAEEQAAPAFGKLNPYEHGVLPVLVVLENRSGKALRVNLQAEYVRPDNKHVPMTPASEVPYLQGPARPQNPGVPRPLPLPKKRSPLLRPEIEQRAFAAKMLPPNDTAYGFVYFQTTFHEGARLVLQGLSEAATGKELFYFEVPLRKP
jgi:hypothetical protein